MKIIEIPPAFTLRLGERLNGTFEAEREYHFCDYLREIVTGEKSGFGAWEKQEVGREILSNVREAKKKKAHEIVLEDAQYQALLDAARAWVPHSEASPQLLDAGFRKALENPKKGKAGE